MPASRVDRPSSARLRRAPTAASLRRWGVLLAVVFVLLATKAGQGRAPAAPLNFFKNYFVSGDYLVRGVGLKGAAAANGFATGKIAIPDNSVVAAGAQPVAAYLYWSTVVAQANLNGGLTGAEFDGHPIADIAKILVPSGTSPCWSSGGATAGGNGDGSKRLSIQRADVLRFLREDERGNALINNTSYTVTFPSNAGGNTVPFTLGASLVLVYRTLTDPLRAVVLYDGGFTINNGTDSLVQPIAGFYDASHTDPKARGTFIVGDGQSNFQENLRFSDNLRTTSGPQLLSSNPFVSADGDAWDDTTYHSRCLPEPQRPRSQSTRLASLQPTASPAVRSW